MKENGFSTVMADLDFPILFWIPSEVEKYLEKEAISYLHPLALLSVHLLRLVHLFLENPSFLYSQEHPELREHLEGLVVLAHCRLLAWNFSERLLWQSY